MTLKALIADDEPLLRQALVRELDAQMPDIEVVAEVGDGQAALDAIYRSSVDIAFLDIRMPGLSGLEVTQSLLDNWHSSPQSDRHPPLVVFVTAYDEYAVHAFEAEAVDYILKPLTTERLQLTLVKIRERLKNRRDVDKQLELETKLERALAQLSDQAGDTSADENVTPALTTIRASVGGKIQLLPVDEVILLQAEDKYVSVYTKSQHVLIRQTLKDLLPRLPSDRFVQIHRASIVNLAFVDAADRSRAGKMTLTIRGLEITPSVSRANRHHFKAM